jgi:cbb3-type cytochrome oxidase subunit 3
MKGLKQKLKISSAIALPSCAFLIGSVASANQDYGLKATAEKGFGANSPVLQNDRTIYTVVGNVINAGLGLLGVVFLILIIIGGIMWMLAAGDEGRVTQSRELIKNAIIGLAIVLAAYSMSYFVVQALINSVTTT